MSETRLVRRDELLLGDKCGGVRGRQPNGCFLDEAIYAGLRPADVLVYVKRSQGRENRPYQKRSTVAAKSATFCKSHTGYHGDKKNDSKDVSILKHASLVQFEGFRVDDVVDEEQVAEFFRFRVTDAERLVEV